MMNKTNKCIVWMMSILCAGIMSLSLTSCTLTGEQIKIVSQNAGLAAVVGWIAQSNPDTNAMALVSSALDIVQTNVNNIVTGQTYTEAMYPRITEFVQSELVPNQYRPLILAGTMSALNGVDILFVMNPSWKAQEKTALDVVNMFIIGAKIGLALSNNDLRIVKARELAVVRAKTWQN